jgi:hypothetical protein
LVGEEVSNSEDQRSAVVVWARCAVSRIRFSGFAYQATASTGASYKFIDNPNTKLQARSAPVIAA